jgi:hypothetical protein
VIEETLFIAAVTASSAFCIEAGNTASPAPMPYARKIAGDGIGYMDWFNNEPVPEHQVGPALVVLSRYGLEATKKEFNGLHTPHIAASV